MEEEERQKYNEIVELDQMIENPIQAVSAVRIYPSGSFPSYPPLALPVPPLLG
ncbi:MAG: hypothetical protein ACP5T5_03025 [Thermoprotei archaeon]